MSAPSPGVGTGTPLLDVRNLTTWFATAESEVRAVTEVDLQVRAGEMHALVGESGSGKSAAVRSILRLHPERSLARSTGEIIYEGVDLLTADEQHLNTLRGRRIGLVLQDPTAALNPVLTIGRQIDLILRHHTDLSAQERRARIIDLLTQVGIPAPEKRMSDYPGQLSGGMRQRVVIAAALSCDPALLIADEPTTALDVTIQAAILELLDRLRRERDMAVLLVTHDLGVVAEHADQVSVMYAGRIVESAPVHQLFAAPQMPYTRALLGSMPQMALAHPERAHVGIPGRPPDLQGPEPPGCAFAPRCSEVMDKVCTTTQPSLVPVGRGHVAACLLHGGTGGTDE